MAQIEEIQLQKRLQAAQKLTAERLERARTAEAATNEERGHTFETQRHTSQAHEELRALGLPGPPAGGREEEQFAVGVLRLFSSQEARSREEDDEEDDLEIEVEALEQRRRSAESLCKKANAEIALLLRKLPNAEREAVIREQLRGGGSARLTAEERQKRLEERGPSLRRPDKLAGEPLTKDEAKKMTEELSRLPKHRQPLAEAEPAAAAPKLTAEERYRRLDDGEESKRRPGKLASEPLTKDEAKKMTEELSRLPKHRQPLAEAESAEPDVLLAPKLKLDKQGRKQMLHRLYPDPAQRPMQQAEVQVPPGSKTGDPITICTPDGRELTVEVPDDVRPGERFTVLIPARLCPAPAEPAPS